MAAPMLLFPLIRLTAVRWVNPWFITAICDDPPADTIEVCFLYEPTPRLFTGAERLMILRLIDLLEIALPHLKSP